MISVLDIWTQLECCLGAKAGLADQVLSVVFRGLLL